MFDIGDAGALLAEMSAAQRAERAAAARRLLAAGQLCRLRMADVAAEQRTQWCIDNWEAVAAEVGAELGISRGRASSAMNYGVELIERLPRLAALFAAGDVDFRVVAAVVFRAGLVTDTDVIAEIDRTIAARAGRWNALSLKRVAELIDQWVARVDPAAVRTARSAERERHIEFGDTRDGMVEFWGSLRAPDAAVLDRRLDELAAQAAADGDRTNDDRTNDDRTTAQRRADALVALAAGGLPGESAQIVIHVLAEAATVSGDGTAPGHLPGYGAIAAETVRELADRAKVRLVGRPEEFRAENGYRPSTALADFVRCRDLHCRFPGCDKPAEFCDIDHTIPWGSGGLTHPSNLALLCRAHHLLKTFYSGENGWCEQQSADGSIVWTSPSGRTYTTTPGGALIFPQLAVPTEELTADVPRRPLQPGRTLMMPTRRRTRAAERAARIAWERGLNEARWAADPPPF